MLAINHVIPRARYCRCRRPVQTTGPLICTPCTINLIPSVCTVSTEHACSASRLSGRCGVPVCRRRRDGCSSTHLVASDPEFCVRDPYADVRVVGQGHPYTDCTTTPVASYHLQIRTVGAPVTPWPPFPSTLPPRKRSRFVLSTLPRSPLFCVHRGQTSTKLDDGISSLAVLGGVRVCERHSYRGGVPTRKHEPAPRYRDSESDS